MTSEPAETSEPANRPNPGELAQRAVDAFMSLVRRGTTFALGFVLVVAFVCLAAFAAGIAALSGGIETVWIVFGGAAAFVAIGAVGLALFRLWVVKRLAVRIVSEVRTMISGDPHAERVVIETVESSDRAQGQSPVVMSRQFFAMSDAIGGHRAEFVAVGTALRSITTFPLLILLAGGITLGFAVLGALFSLALIL